MPYYAQRDLRSKHPNTTYPYLVSTDSTGSLFDGTGSQITSVNVTASFASTSSWTSLQSCSIQVVNKNGVIKIYNPSADTDSSRGQLLLTASLSASSGDSIFLSNHTYDIGNNQIDLSMSGSGTLSLYGAGKYNTIIKSSIEFTTGSIIQPGTNSETANLTISGSGGDAVEQNPWGTYNLRGFDNAILRNVYIKNASDGVLVYYPTNTSSAYIYNLTVQSKWDCVNHKTLGGSVYVYDSYLSASATGSVNSGQDAICVNSQTGSITNVFNTIMHADGGTRLIWAVYANGGVMNLYGNSITTIDTSPSLGTYDLKQTSNGILNVSMDTKYAPKKASGTIRYASLLPGSGSASATPNITGSVNFELISNTTLLFRVLGYDGVLRSGSITLI